MLSMLLLMACEGTPSDTASTVTIPDLPTSGCGGAPYAWLPLEQVGGVVDWERVGEWSLSAEEVRTIVGLAGVSDTSMLTHDVQAYRVRYTTQDRGQPAEATQLVVVPDTEGHVAMPLLYLHPTTGVEDFCAPSGRDLLYVGPSLAFAAQGFAVSAPDYLGQNGFGAASDAPHPFLVAEPAAISSLDAVRAMRAFVSGDPVSVALSEEALLLGPSQGGAAAVWAERYAPAYLPEFSITGSVISVPPLDVVGLVDEGSQELSIGTGAASMALVSHLGWYGLDADLDDVLQPAARGWLEDALATTCPDAAVPEEFSSIEAWFTDDWRASVRADDLGGWEPWSCMLAESSVGHGQAPLGSGQGIPNLVILAGADEYIFADVQRAAVRSLCDEGHAVVAVECEGMSHIEAVQSTLGMQLGALETLRAGDALGGDVCGEVVVQQCG